MKKREEGPIFVTTVAMGSGVGFTVEPHSDGLAQVRLANTFGWPDIIGERFLVEIMAQGGVVRVTLHRGAADENEGKAPSQTP